MPRCPECEFLQRKRAEAVLKHAELRDQLRQAVQHAKSETVTALMISEAAALKERDEAEAAIRRHDAIAHGDGDAEGQTV